MTDTDYRINLSHNEKVLQDINALISSVHLKIVSFAIWMNIFSNDVRYVSIYQNIDNFIQYIDNIVIQYWLLGASIH